MTCELSQFERAYLHLSGLLHRRGCKNLLDAIGSISIDGGHINISFALGNALADAFGNLFCSVRVSEHCQYDI